MKENGNLRAALSITDVIEVSIILIWDPFPALIHMLCGF